MRFSICLAISVFIIACAQQPPTPGPTPPQPVNCPGMTSPDQQLRACVLSVGTHPNPPFNESRVEIRNMGGTMLATKDFKSPDGEHGRNVQKMEWSPDSQFFVFSTASAGGHSPWHWQTYFYDRRTKHIQRSRRLHRACHQAKLQIDCSRLDRSPGARHPW